MKPAAGVYVNDPLLLSWKEAALLGPLTRTAFTGGLGGVDGGTMSLAFTPGVATDREDVPDRRTYTSSAANGEALVTWIVTVAGLDSSRPSLALYWNVSAPV